MRSGDIETIVVLHETLTMIFYAYGDNNLPYHILLLVERANSCRNIMNLRVCLQVWLCILYNALFVFRCVSFRSVIRG